MAHLKKVFSSLKRTIFVRDHDGVTLPIGGPPIDADYRNASRGGRTEFRREVAAGGRNDEQARGTVGAQFVQIGFFLPRIVVRIAEDHSERAFEGDVFDAANNAREKRIENVWNDHSQHV